MPEKLELYDRKGRRKFITPEERTAFLDASYDAPAHQRSLCLVLAHTGCHLTEALQLTPADIDLAGDAIMLDDDRKRTRGVPVPSSVTNALDIIHGIRRAQNADDASRSAKLWPVDRSTAWRWILRIMKDADIYGPQATPRGLRHGFIVESLASGVPIETVQKWTGHKDVGSTECFADALQAAKRNET